MAHKAKVIAIYSLKGGVGQLPGVPSHPRVFLSELATRLYPTGLPPADAQARRLDQPHDSLFDLKLPGD